MAETRLDEIVSPAAYVELDEEGQGMKIDDVIRKLRDGDPGIAVDRSRTGMSCVSKCWGMEKRGWWRIDSR